MSFAESHCDVLITQGIPEKMTFFYGKTTALMGHHPNPVVAIQKKVEAQLFLMGQLPGVCRDLLFITLMGFT